QFVLVPGTRGRITGGHALVAELAGDAIQRLGGNLAHLDPAATRLLLDLDQARVARAGFDQHLAHVLGVVLDRRGHGIDTHDPLVLLAHVRDRRRKAGIIAPGTTTPECGQRTRDRPSVLLLGPLGRLPARWRGRQASLGVLVLDQAEVDLALFQAGLEHDDPDPV